MVRDTDKTDGLKFIRELIDASVDQLPAEGGRRISEVITFRKSITNESDRGAGLMAAAFIDDRLAELISSKLINDDALIKSLLDFNGPFGNFSARIEVSFGFGLIPNNVRRDLNLLRKIRNDFAHTANQVTFYDQPIASRCRELALDNKSKDANPRGKFTRAMVVCLVVIQLAILRANRPEQPNDHDVSISQKGVETVKKFLNDKGHNELDDLIE